MKTIVRSLLDCDNYFGDRRFLMTYGEQNTPVKWDRKPLYLVRTGTHCIPLIDHLTKKVTTKGLEPFKEEWVHLYSWVGFTVPLKRCLDTSKERHVEGINTIRKSNLDRLDQRNLRVETEELNHPHDPKLKKERHTVGVFTKINKRRISILWKGRIQSRKFLLIKYIRRSKR